MLTEEKAKRVKEGVNRTGVGGKPKGHRHDPKIHMPIGRQKGVFTPQREALGVIIVEAMNGEHPLQALARLAKKSEDEGDITLAVVCYKELANYIAPKLKAVEITKQTEQAKPITIIINESITQQVEDNRRKALRPVEDGVLDD